MTGKPLQKRVQAPHRIVVDGLPRGDAYRSFFLNSPNTVVLVRPDGTVLDVNPAAEKLFRKPAAKLIGLHQRFLHPEWDRHLESMRFRRHADSCLHGQSVRSETYVASGRREIPVEIITQIVKVNGQTCVQGIFRDISDSYKIQKSLTASIKRYHSLFNCMTEAFALHEAIMDSHGRPRDYRFIEINPAFEKHTGVSRKQLLGKTFRQVFKREDPLWVRIYGDVVLTGKPIAFEHYSVYLKRYFQVFAYSTGPGQFASVFSDITERREAENALRYNEERLRALVEASSQILWSTDSRGYLKQIHTSVPFSGIPIKKLLGLGWIQVVHPDDRPKVIHAWRRCVKERSLYLCEYRLRRSDGEYRYMLSRGVPIFTPEGRVKEWIGVCTDVTDQKRLEHERRRFSELMMRAREEEKRQLSSLLHDEMGSWTVSLSSALVLAEGSVRAGRTREALSTLGRARRLIKTMASQSRALSVDLRPPAMDISGLSGALSDLVSRLRAVVKPDIKLKLCLPDEREIDGWVKIVAYRIVQEALTNALKYANARSVSVSANITGETGKLLRLRIADDGRGFDVQKPRLRRDSLGLRIMKNEAESAGGIWAVESAPGKGTVIWAQFPLGRRNGGKNAY